MFSVALRAALGAQEAGDGRTRGQELRALHQPRLREGGKPAATPLPLTEQTAVLSTEAP